MNESLRYGEKELNDFIDRQNKQKTKEEENPDRHKMMRYEGPETDDAEKDPFGVGKGYGAKKLGVDNQESETTNSTELVTLNEVKPISSEVINDALSLVEADNRKNENLKILKELILRLVREALEKVLASDGNAYEVKGAEGNSQKEGVPVDKMINFLLEEIDPESKTEISLKGDNNTLRDEVLTQVMHPFNRLSHLERSKVDESEAAIIENIDFILTSEEIAEEDRKRLEMVKLMIEKSERFFDLDRSSSQFDEEGRRVNNGWRTDHEAEEIKEDEVRDMGSEDANQEKAKADLNDRREVFVEEEENVPGGEAEKEITPKVVDFSVEDAEPTDPKTEPRQKALPPHPEQDALPPHVEEKEKIKIADISEIVKAMAWRIAENRVNEVINSVNVPQESGFFGKIKSAAKGMWSRLTTREGWQSSLHAMSEEGYRKKYYDEAIAEIQGNNDLLNAITNRAEGEGSGGTTPEKIEHHEILDAVVKQMELGLVEACEQGEDLVDRSAQFAELFNRHLKGEFSSRSEFEAAAEEAIRNSDLSQEEFAKDESRRDEAEGLMYASNLWDIAERFKTQREEEIDAALGSESLSDVEKEAYIEGLEGLNDLDIQLVTKFGDINEDRARRPDKKGRYFSWADNALDRLYSVPVVGSVAKKITHPVAVGLAASLLARPAAKGIILGAAATLGVGTGFALPILIGAGIAGAISYGRRARKVGHERGMESRRQTLGEEGEGQTAEQLRENTFAQVDGEALLEAIGSDNEDVQHDALVEASSLLEAERRLRAQGRNTDLIRIGQAEGQRLQSNIVTKTELMAAVSEAGLSEKDQLLINDRADEHVSQVREKDRDFESYRKKESLRAAAKSAATAAVLGFAATEIADEVSEHMHNAGEQNNVVTASEWMQGQRPDVHHYELDSPKGPDGEKIWVFENNSDSIPVEVNENLDVELGINAETGQLEPYGALPAGVTLEDGQIVQHIEGLEGGELNAENWGALRDKLVEDNPELFTKTESNWTRFMSNDRQPLGNSYHPEGYTANSEGTELGMSFLPSGGDGSVDIDISAMAGHTAFGGGHSIDIGNDTQLFVTIGPREYELSHDVLVVEITPGENAHFPKGLADRFFEKLSNGKIIPREGFQITVDQAIDGNLNTIGDMDETNMASFAAEINGSEGTVDAVAGIDNVVSMPSVTEHNAGDVLPPIALGSDREKHVGKKKSAEDKTNKDQLPPDPKNPETEEANKALIMPEDKKEQILEASREAVKSGEPEKASILSRLIEDEQIDPESLKEEIKNDHGERFSEERFDQALAEITLIVSPPPESSYEESAGDEENAPTPKPHEEETTDETKKRFQEAIIMFDKAIKAGATFKDRLQAVKNAQKMGFYRDEEGKVINKIRLISLKEDDQEWDDQEWVDISDLTEDYDNRILLTLRASKEVLKKAVEKIGKTNPNDSPLSEQLKGEAEEKPEIEENVVDEKEDEVELENADNEKEGEIEKIVLNRDRKEQLTQKLEEYQQRDPYKAPETKMDTVCKTEVLNALLEDGEVDTENLREELRQKYRSGFHEPAFDNAIFVINNYNENGGVDVSGGSGLPQVEAKEGEEKALSKEEAAELKKLSREYGDSLSMKGNSRPRWILHENIRKGTIVEEGVINKSENGKVSPEDNYKLSAEEYSVFGYDEKTGMVEMKISSKKPKKRNESVSIRLDRLVKYMEPKKGHEARRQAAAETIQVN